ncbi:MAG: long-chain acyl-CoA synthetase [Gammaproteobacteria bacterium]|jgi:long-chain acyl-CoA synthetase
MDKAWLKSYPDGMPETVDINAYQSVAEVFEKSASRYSDRPAFSNLGTTLTYSEMDQLTGHLASYLQRLPDMKQGDRVAIMMPNVLQNPIAIFAVLRAGFTVVNTNPLYTPRELEHQLTDSGAKAIIVMENFCSTLAEVIDQTTIQHVITTQLGDMLKFPKSFIVNFVVKHIKKMVLPFTLKGSVKFKVALAEGARVAHTQVSISPEDIAFLQYTGGTTGVAKGAMLTNRNMVANMQQASAWIKNMVDEGKDVIITALPLYHIFSLTANCLTFMKAGAENHLITNPRDMAGFVKELQSIPFTAITGVNTLFVGLMNTPGFDDIDFSHLKLTLGGGMAVQKPVAERWKKATGGPLLEAYGLTETSPAVCINPLNLLEYNGSIGLPVPSTEVSIQDADGKILPQGESGELCVRGPQVMKGYWNREDETAKVMTDDGWLRTGDIAKMDKAGFFRIMDRLKDMILVSGFNVYPNEIEAIIMGHVGVSEVGVVGEPNPKGGEIIKAVIVKRDQTLTEESVIQHCIENLTKYKVPKIIEFRAELPKTNVGKILRRKLKISEK